MDVVLAIVAAVIGLPLLAILFMEILHLIGDLRRDD